MGADMILRHVADGWHFGIAFDDPEIDDFGDRLPDGVLTDEVASLVKANGVKVIEIREDVPAPDGEVDALVELSGRKLRSAIRYTAPEE